jgi:hypothetical protein
MSGYGIRLKRRPGLVLTSENPWVGRPTWGFGRGKWNSTIMAMRRFSLMTVLLATKAAFCSPPDACSLTSTVTDAKLALSFADARTSYREGEIIPLVLSFTSTVDKRYRAADRNYDRSGRLNIDTYCLDPEARDPLADYIFGGFGGGIGGERQLWGGCLAAPIGRTSGDSILSFGSNNTSP